MRGRKNSELSELDNSLFLQTEKRYSGGGYLLIKVNFASQKDPSHVSLCSSFRMTGKCICGGLLLSFAV